LVFQLTFFLLLSKSEGRIRTNDEGAAAAAEFGIQGMLRPDGKCLSKRFPGANPPFRKHAKCCMISLYIKLHHFLTISLSFRVVTQEMQWVSG